MWIRRVLVTAIVGVCVACGGGTRGTGDLTIEGRVATTTGSALSGASVTVLRTGDSGVSDANGFFSIVTDPFEGEPELLVEAGSVSVTSRGGTITSDAEIVDVQIEVETRGTPSARQSVTIKKRRPGGASGNGGGSGGGGNGGGNSGGGGGNGSGGNGSDDDSDGDDDSDDDGDDDGEGPQGGGAGGGGGGSQGGGSGNGGSGGSGGASGGGSGGSGGDERVEVEGEITALSGSTVTVQGRTFAIDGNTDFGARDSLSEFSIGERVEVRGRTRGGVLVAERVRLKE